MKEIESLSGSTNEFDQFYQQFAELKEIHRRHPNLQVEDLEKNYRKHTREDMEEDRNISPISTADPFLLQRARRALKR